MARRKKLVGKGGIYIQLEGYEQTMMNIKKLDDELRKELKSVTTSNARKIRDEAKRLAPVGAKQNKWGGEVRYGHLKESIKMKTYFSGLGAMVYPEKSIAYWRHFVEYGTKDRYQRKSKKYVGKMKPQPYMQPAKDKFSKPYNAQVKKIVSGTHYV